MTSIELFSWNLNGLDKTEMLAKAHMALRASQGPLIACLQEVHSKSDLCVARTLSRSQRSSKASAARNALKNLSLNVVPHTVRGIALVYSDQLVLVSSDKDTDDEYVWGLFELHHSNNNSPTRILVVGVHAKSKSDMPHAEDHGASRALLRQTLNELFRNTPADHVVLLGDFNSRYDAHEVGSWHCFHAKGERFSPIGPPYRRGVPHPVLRIVTPTNPQQGTFVFAVNNSILLETIDFIVVDEASYNAAPSSKILTTISGQNLWDPQTSRICLGDHLPVEGTLHV